MYAFEYQRVKSVADAAAALARSGGKALAGGRPDDVILATAQGMLARFDEDEVRPMGRDAAGVIGIRLLKKEGDSVVAMTVVEPAADLLVLTETGYGKRVALAERERLGERLRQVA